MSFGDSIEPVIEEVCARCHTGEGPGTADLAIDTAGAVAEAADDIALVVASGTMPPWPSSHLSVAFRGDWSLSAGEIDSIVAWARAGAPLDVAADEAIDPAGGVVGLADADVELRPAVGYGSSAGRPDQYRCFVYDPELDSERFVAAYEFVPDQAEVVHHVIGYLIPASMRERAQALDDADEGGGWTCFGGSRLGMNDIFLGWAPGQTPSEFPAGSGLKMGEGDFMVVQIHYHFEVDAPPDRSALRISWIDEEQGAEIREVQVGQYFAPAEIPCFGHEQSPLCDRDAAMTAALEKYGRGGVQADFILALCGQSALDVGVLDEAGVARSSCDQPVYNPGRVVSVLGHAHELGRSFRMTLNPGRSDERILLDIPDWSFDWQLIYEPVDEIVIRAGDTIRVECSWDRNRRDPALSPAYVLWADGTDDEMCFATIATVDESGAGTEGGSPDLLVLFDDETRACVGRSVPGGSARDPIALASALLQCDDPAIVGERAVDTVSAVFRVTVGDRLKECLAARYSESAHLGELLTAYAEPHEPSAVAPAAATFAECAPLGSVIANAVPGLDLSEESIACLDERGGPAVEDLFAGALRGEAPQLPTVALECMSMEDMAGLGS